MHFQKFVPTLCFALLMSGIPGAIASQNATHEKLRSTFELPTYVRQPLPDTLQAAQDWQTVGMNALIAQDYINSLEAFDKAVDLSAGQNPEILEQRGWVHYRQEQYVDAIADLNRAATLYQNQSQTSDYKNVRRMRTFIEAQSERFDSAS